MDRRVYPCIRSKPLCLNLCGSVIIEWMPRSPEKKYRELIEFLEREIWRYIPDDMRGKVISKAEREEILGIGPNGYCVPIDTDFSLTDIESA